MELRDVFETKNANENVYFVSGVTTGTLQVYGKQIDSIILEEININH
jgi:hypothetical protein